ncbi:MAG TPA: hypothetical protein VJ728_13530, partial [Candidatus Binataceae bacterium]|nr:hypothetical protein [Candidatus Binataceae bacterium]
NQKIVILSLLGWEFPFTKVRDALKSEFGRFIKRQQRRAPWWQYHYKDVDKLKGAQRAKRIRQLPRLDPDLAATGLCLGDEAIFQVALRAHWGGKRTEIPSIIAKDLTEKLGLSEMLPSELFELLDIPGSWGSPGESKNAGYEVLGQMSEDDLRSARDRFYFVFGGLFASAMFLGVLGDPAEKVITAYSKGIEALVGPDWIIATMATFAISAFHNRTSRPKGAQDPFKVLDSLAESAVLSSRLWGLT